MGIEQMQEVVGLQQHVAELGEGDPLTLPIQAGLHRLLRHHLIDGEVLPDVPEELEERHGSQPVGVVEQECLRVAGAGAEVEESAQLPSDPLEVGSQIRLGQQRPFLRLAARVADEPGTPAGQGDGPVSAELHATKGADLEEMPDVEAIGSGGEAAIDGEATGIEMGFEAWVGHLVHQPPKAEVLGESGHGLSLPRRPPPLVPEREVGLCYIAATSGADRQADRGAGTHDPSSPRARAVPSLRQRPYRFGSGPADRADRPGCRLLEFVEYVDHHHEGHHHHDHLGDQCGGRHRPGQDAAVAGLRLSGGLDGSGQREHQHPGQFLRRDRCGRRRGHGPLPGHPGRLGERQPRRGR